MLKHPSSPNIRKHKIVGPKGSGELTRIPAANARLAGTHRFEYVSPIIWMPPMSNTVWVLDVSSANRGLSEETVSFIFTEFHFAPDQPSSFVPGGTVFPGRAFLLNMSFETLGGDANEYQGWWVRVFTSSRNVVPSIHFYGVEVVNSPVEPSYPEFYFSPGDFAVFDVFDLPGGAVLLPGGATE
jgi:hypothetical protein